MISGEAPLGRTEPGRRRSRDQPQRSLSGSNWVRALAITWLFAGLRSDEIVRLRVGCARWQPRVDGARDQVCLLDVPAHKTGAPFTKPVDALVGQAIDAWEAVRPAQPPLLEPRTGELVAILFCLRAKRVARDYFNRVLIPVLCGKAGVPRADPRGRITSWEPNDRRDISMPRALGFHGRGL